MPFDVDGVGQAGGLAVGSLSSSGGGLRLHRQQQQQNTEPAASQRLIHPRRDGERKRDSRAAATEKELLHLNHKIVSNSVLFAVVELLTALMCHCCDKTESLNK